MLRHGLRNGAVVSIDEIGPDVWGVACGCICPNPHCGEMLIAKSRDFPGRKQCKHFAHASGAECSAATESALHRLAKEIIVQEMAVMVPSVSLNTVDASPSLNEVSPPHVLSLDSVRVEEAVDGLRPDLTATSGDSEVFIEIRVSHAVDDRKRAQAHASQWTLLEIDLRDLRETDFDRRSVSDRLLGAASQRWWIRHQAAETARLRLLEAADAVEGECPAGLGVVPRIKGRIPKSGSLDFAPCVDCPSCFGVQNERVQCLYNSGVYSSSDVLDQRTPVRTKESDFFAMRRGIIAKHRAWLADREAQIAERARVGSVVAPDRAGSLAETMLRRDHPLWSHLHQLSSRILAAYKRDSGPLVYHVHLVPSRPSAALAQAQATFHVGPDAVYQIQRGSRPGYRVGEGFIYPSGDSYGVMLRPMEPDPF
jgi:hypothetical protein